MTDEVQDKALDAPERLWISKAAMAVLYRHFCDVPQSDRVEYSRVRADLASDWQPIESAPKNGKVILGFCDRKTCAQGVVKAMYLQRKDIWVSPDGAEGYDLTHWRPLPPPPFASKPRLHCSCGAAVTAEEYELHRQRGHD